MSQITLVKTPEGKWKPLTPKDAKRFAKIRLRQEHAEPGECLIYTFKEPRSPRHFGFFFSKLRELFDRQERFSDPDRLLDWLLVGAGWCDLMPAPLAGGLVAMPRSIAWDNCDEQTFIEVTKEIDAFMWSDEAQAFLWPHLSAAARHENVQGWHDKAEENRQAAVARMMAEGRA